LDDSGLRDRLFGAARSGDAEMVKAMLEEDPRRIDLRMPPYDWSVLHAASQAGQLRVVETLLALGHDPNVRESGDNTCAMHWAAAAGHVDIVRRLADAGGDVIGAGDDHQLEVIGWATCWDGCDDDAHRGIVSLLLERGARHHIFSAIATGSDDEVRRIARETAAELSRLMSHNENFQRPLHFAVRTNRPAMVALLLELGADSEGVDGSGETASEYATTPGADRPLLELRRSRGTLDLPGAVALGDWPLAERMIQDDSSRMDASHGALHLTAKRGDAVGVQWLLSHGADPDGRWDHFGAVVAPLHLAAINGHARVVRVLLDGGADRSIRDSMHDSDALGWAEVAGRQEVVAILGASNP
jgi:ankyrin repeat protein